MFSSRRQACAIFWTSSGSAKGAVSAGFVVQHGLGEGEAVAPLGPFETVDPTAHHGPPGCLT